MNKHVLTLMPRKPSDRKEVLSIYHFTKKKPPKIQRYDYSPTGITS